MDVPKPPPGNETNLYIQVVCLCIPLSPVPLIYSASAGFAGHEEEKRRRGKEVRTEEIEACEEEGASEGKVEERLQSRRPGMTMVILVPMEETHLQIHQMKTRSPFE